MNVDRVTTYTVWLPKRELLTALAAAYPDNLPLAAIAQAAAVDVGYEGGQLQLRYSRRGNVEGDE